jgi:hypothetical protein
LAVLGISAGNPVVGDHLAAHVTQGNFGNPDPHDVAQEGKGVVLCFSRFGISNSHDPGDVFQRRVSWIGTRLIAAAESIYGTAEPEGYSGVCGSCCLG